MREPNTIKLSSKNPTISVVSAPLRRSSPRDLKGAKESDWAFQSDTTCESLASMSFSLTAEMQISYDEIIAIIYLLKFCQVPVSHAWLKEIWFLFSALDCE